MKILIIGAGNMGITYGEGIIHSNVIHRANLYFIERTEEKAPLIKDISSHPLYTKPDSFVSEMDMVILSVKPQDFPTLAHDLAPFIRKDQLIFSIMAGIRMKTLAELLPATKIIRAMPNLPAQVGLGMTVFTTSPEVDKKDLFIAQNLLNTTGKAIYTPDESLIDAATAISGSGPAYVFYFIQGMIEAGIKMGFSEYEAQLLVEQTFLGAIHLLQKNNLSCQDWIQRVSSKGGTTEAAISMFQHNGLQESIGEGMEAALRRSRELSGEK